MAARTLRLDGATATVEIEQGPEGPRVSLDGRWYDVDFRPTGRHGLYSLLVDGRSWEVYAQPRPGGWDILIGNRVYSVETEERRGGRQAQAAAAEAAGAWTLRSPLAGIVAETLVREGDAVQAGQVLLIVESMKMNNELTAARAGTVTAVHVRPGERVDRGAALVGVE